MPEPNKIPNNLRLSNSKEISCANCAWYEDSDSAYGTCTAFEHLVKPELVCDSYTDPSAV